MARAKAKYYPIQLDVAGKKCIVVGGGDVALRKAKSLLDAGARVVVISPKISRGFRQTRNLRLVRRRYRPGDVKGASLVIAATDDEAVNREVSKETRALNIPVNVVDRPDLCSFIVPASVRRGGLTISVSTGGASPYLAARIRKQIEKKYGDEYGDLVDAVGALRAVVMEKVPDPGHRRRIFERMSSPAMLGLVRQKGKSALRTELRKLINAK